MKVNKGNTNNKLKSRKQIRKENRIAKKQRKNEFYQTKKKPVVNNSNAKPSKSTEDSKAKETVKPKHVTQKSTIDEQDKCILKEKKEKTKIEAEMRKSRNKLLLQANRDEDRNIKHLEKQLKLNKRKSKNIPKSFVEDGLDFLLEVCDAEKMKSLASSEDQFAIENDELEEDFALMTGKELKTNGNKTSKSKGESDMESGGDYSDDDDDEVDSDAQDGGDSGEDDDSGLISNEDNAKKNGNSSKAKLTESNSEESEGENDSDSDDDIQDDTDYYYNGNDDDLLESLEDECENNEVDSFKEQFLKSSKVSENDEEGDSDNDEEEDENLDTSEDEDDDDDNNDDFYGGAGGSGLNNFNADYSLSESEDEGHKSSDDYDNNNVDNNNYEGEFNGYEASLKGKKGIVGVQSITKSSSKKASVTKTLKDSSEKTVIHKDKRIREELDEEAVFNISKKKKATKTGTKRKADVNESCPKSNKQVKNSDDELEGIKSFDEDDGSDPEGESDDNKKAEVWEDIYGRLRDKDGQILKESTEKYIPPAVRAKMESEFSNDKRRIEKLNRLKRTMKGLFNRLAESNMHSIVTQIEELYRNNSRNDMNETITNLVFDSAVSPALTPERLLLEHVVLITILHANVGTEVGAHFLQTVVNKFDSLHKSNQEVEDKTLDNIVNIIGQLYNFKVFQAQLLYQVLDKLSSKFDEKSIECIVHVLKNVGFSLRKDDPLALKNLILNLQKQAGNVSEEEKDNARVKYLLDILLAIKNNNVKKIPNYDNTYAEHLKKIMKGFIRKGCYVTQLNISLDDLLKAEERGKWWVVGSAWTGTIENNNQSTEKVQKADKFSEKLLELARKQRMNTDTRRNIFCILMSAEDYLDAFEKLLHLGLKNQEEREIINVILHCCLQEKKFNPYYAVLAQKFCEYDRKFQMIIKCSVWDKLKALTDCSGVHLSNLAKMLSHLFLEKGLPISTLKIIQFTELEKKTVRFIRQVLLGILLHDNNEQIQEVFEKVAINDKLKMFKESLRLFLHHFLLKNMNETIPEDVRQLVQERAKMIDKILSVTVNRTKF